jgi:Asp-tRNA(Asn)/Glu-tRNA(Gln) amidotransferase A subunit family amidase
MTDTLDALRPCSTEMPPTVAYLDDAADLLPALPEALALDLRSRAQLIGTGELTHDELWAATEDWDPPADSAFRPLVGGRRGPPVEGVVRLGVKDTVDVAGWPTRLGLRHHRHYPRHAAAVLDGIEPSMVTAKLATTELTIGVGAGCVNPYYPHLDPSASSTGSAVAVAAFLCDVALGTDALGSSRMPAGACGVTGLRMTYDARWLAGMYPVSPALDAPGWLARTAADLQYWFAEGMRDAGLCAPLGSARPAPRRIGVVREARFDGDAHPACRSALDHTVAVLRDAGYDVREVELGALWEARGSAWELCAREAWDGYRAVEQRVGGLGAPTWAALSIGARISDERYEQVLGDVARCRREASRGFDDVDVWLLPLAPSLPLDVAAGQGMECVFPVPGSDEFGRGLGYTPIASICGLPALSLPVAEAEQAPVSMQLVGPPHAEGPLLHVATTIERACPPPALTAATRLAR